MADDEHRGGQRVRILKSGLIVFNDGRSTIECTVRNLSEGGAQLKVTSLLGIPDEFTLKLKDAGTAHARVAWRKAETNTIGVKFDSD